MSRTIDSDMETTNYEQLGMVIREHGEEALAGASGRAVSGGLSPKAEC
jgi:hypothetical protein